MPDTLPDIVVTGQRRRPGGAFPARGGGGTGGDDGLGTETETDEVDPGQPGVSPPDPCADPATALP